jgi:Arc/MetJ-type ribon-helix-helix transcriptional regulator
MEIRLRPELEELIKRDLARGPYFTVDEYVEHAVTLLHEEESWLAERGSDIGAQIEAGYAAAEYGGEIESDELRSRMSEKKRVWLDKP